MHGDFYAHNVLLHPGGDCLLGDFGAAFTYPEGGGLERIEVRAFGCLLEELLERCEFHAEQAAVVTGLWVLQKRCVAEDVRARPCFAEIHRELGK